MNSSPNFFVLLMKQGVGVNCWFTLSLIHMNPLKKRQSLMMLKSNRSVRSKPTFFRIPLLSVFPLFDYTAKNILHWKFSFYFPIFLSVHRTSTKVHCLLGINGPRLFKMKHNAKCGILNKDLKVAADNFMLFMFDGIWHYHSD